MRPTFFVTCSESVDDLLDHVLEWRSRLVGFALVLEVLIVKSRLPAASFKRPLASSTCLSDQEEKRPERCD
jgi:hypothetical protein